MAQQFWIGVVAGDMIAPATSAGICAFSHGKRSAVERLKTGDRFAYYAPKTGVGAGEPIQSFVALGTVTGDEAFEQDWADTGMSAWVRDASYEQVALAPVKPLLGQLGFVTNPRYWGMAFRRSLFEISSEDFALIENAMRPDA